MKKKILIVISIILLLSTFATFTVHAYADNNIYKKNMIANPDGTVTITIPGALFHRYAFMENSMEELLDDMRSEEGTADSDYKSLQYHVADDDSMTIVMSYDDYDIYFEDAKCFPNLIDEFCSETGMECSFNEDYSLCTIYVAAEDYKFTKDNISTRLIPLSAKIIMDYFHAFQGTLEVDTQVNIVDSVSGNIIDKSDNYEWVESIADVTGVLGVSVKWVD